MAAKQLIFDENSRQTLLRGVTKLAKAVTATVLAEAIFREGLKYVTSGENPIGIQRGITKAVAAAVDQLDKIAKKVKDKEEIKQVATVSANWDNTIGEIIADAMDKVGKDGTITVEE